MKKYSSIHFSRWAISVVLAGMLAGCGSQSIKVGVYDAPKSVVSEKVIDNKSHLYIKRPKGYYPAPVMVNSKAALLLGGQTFAHITLEPGKHWIGFVNDEESVYLCREFEPNTAYFYLVKPKMGIAVERLRLEESNKDGFSKLDQVIKSYDDNLRSVSRSVHTIAVDSSDADLSEIAESLKATLLNSGFRSGNELAINLELEGKDDGNQMARWFGLSEEGKAFIALRASMLINGKLVDEFYVRKELSGGVFGGSADSLIDVAVNDIASYVSCVYSE